MIRACITIIYCFPFELQEQQLLRWYWYAIIWRWTIYPCLIYNLKFLQMNPPPDYYPPDQIQVLKWSWSPTGILPPIGSTNFPLKTQQFLFNGQLIFWKQSHWVGYIVQLWKWLIYCFNECCHGCAHTIILTQCLKDLYQWHGITIVSVCMVLRDCNSFMFLNII